jgi:hypothetical protein
MLAFEATHTSQCFRLRYEDYATDPARFLPPLFEFLGEAWSSDVLRFAEQSHDPGLQDSKVLETRDFRPNIGTWHDWPEEELTRARELISPTLAKLDYRAWSPGP